MHAQQEFIETQSCIHLDDALSPKPELDELIVAGWWGPCYPQGLRGHSLEARGLSKIITLPIPLGLASRLKHKERGLVVNLNSGPPCVGQVSFLSSFWTLSFNGAQTQHKEIYVETPSVMPDRIGNSRKTLSMSYFMFRFRKISFNGTHFCQKLFSDLKMEGKPKGRNRSVWSKSWVLVPIDSLFNVPLFLSLRCAFVLDSDSSLHNRLQPRSYIRHRVSWAIAFHLLRVRSWTGSHLLNCLASSVPWMVLLRGNTCPPEILGFCLTEEIIFLSVCLSICLFSNYLSSICVFTLNGTTLSIDDLVIWKPFCVFLNLCRCTFYLLLKINAFFKLVHILFQVILKASISNMLKFSFLNT